MTKSQIQKAKMDEALKKRGLIFDKTIPRNAGKNKLLSKRMSLYRIENTYE